MKPAVGFVLGALCMGALGIAGPTTAPTGYAAKESITLHVGDTIAPHYAVLTDTVLGVAPGKIIAKHCGTSRAFLRFWKLRPATKDSIVTNGDSVNVSVTGTTTQPCVAEVIVPATDTGFTLLASTNFESGTLDAPFWNPYAGVDGGRLGIIDDPTGSGRGKVLRIHYENLPSSGWYDDNDAIALPQTDAYSLRYGQTVDFEGDVYFGDAPNDTTLNKKALRKLLYWGGDSAAFVLVTQPYDGQTEQLFVTNNYRGQAAEDYAYFNILVKGNLWHHVHVRLTMESALAKHDGKETLWWDGVQFYDRSDMNWTNAAWTGDQKSIYWYGFRVGEQLNSSAQVKEDRYWDNLVFKIKR